MSEKRTDPTTWRADVLLDAVAYANQAVREERRDGHLVLHVPIRKTWYNRPPFSWILQYRDERGFAVDQLGEFVWQACDGKQTVEQIIEGFATLHQLRFHEARLAVTRFLENLVERRLVVVVLPEQAIVESLPDDPAPGKAVTT